VIIPLLANFQVVDGQLVQLISARGAIAQLLYGVVSAGTYNNNRTFTSFTSYLRVQKEVAVPVIHTLNIEIYLILLFLSL